MLRRGKIPEVPTGPRPSPLNGWIRVAMESIVDGTNESTNIFWLQIDATEAEAFDASDSSAFLTAVANAWGTHISPHQSNSANLSLIKYSLKRASGAYEDLSSPNIPGSINADVEPAQVCLDLNWTIGAFYRGGHPRTQLGGIPIGKRTNSRLWDPTYLSSVVSDMAAFHGALNSITTPDVTSYQHFIPSFQTAGAWRSPPIVRNIVSVVGRRTIGTQRRRVTGKIV